MGGASGVGGDGTDAGGSTASCLSDEQCVPAAPAGWDYSFLAGFAFADPGPSSEPCPGGSSPTRYFMTPETGSSCATCACGPRTGAACSVPLECGTDSSCAANPDISKDDSSCHDGGSSKKIWCKLGSPVTTSAGACAPSGGELSKPDPWQQLADVCVATASTSCGTGMQCVPRGTGSYIGFVCISVTGEQTCPADYPVESRLYKNQIDTRACSPCSCTPNPLACLGAEYEIVDDSNCVLGSKTVNSASCTDVSSWTDSGWPGWGYQRKSSPQAKGDCAAAGGQLSGDVKGDPQAALTVCCRSIGT
jgi:hypothetical protein